MGRRGPGRRLRRRRRRSGFFRTRAGWLVALLDVLARRRIAIRADPAVIRTLSIVLAGKNRGPPLRAGPEPVHLTRPTAALVRALDRANGDVLCAFGHVVCSGMEASRRRRAATSLASSASWVRSACVRCTAILPRRFMSNTGEYFSNSARSARSSAQVVCRRSDTGGGGYRAWPGLRRCPISHFLQRFDGSVDCVTRNLVSQRARTAQTGQREASKHRHIGRNAGES